VVCIACSQFQKLRARLLAIGQEKETTEQDLAADCDQKEGNGQIYMSGNVQPHAGRAERMCISSPSDIRIIKINTPIFCSFYIFQSLYLIYCDVKKNVHFRAHKKTQFM
jgi:hypothetical protein